MIYETLLSTIAQAAGQDSLQFTPINSGTILGGVAVLISLVISGAGLLRSYRLDQRTAKKQDIDTVIENYRLLLNEAKEREKKLEAIVERQGKQLEAAEKLIDEQKAMILELNHKIERYEAHIAKLEKELKRYTDKGKGAIPNAT